MSPAGLKGIAEEAGREMVIVCGANMGDIFRRNSFNLGLHVVQSPEAVADAQDGDVFSFDPATRELRNETQGKTYQPVIYEGAGHGFMRAGEQPEHDPGREIDRQVWREPYARQAGGIEQRAGKQHRPAAVPRNDPADNRRNQTRNQQADRGAEHHRARIGDRAQREPATEPHDTPPEAVTVERRPSWIRNPFLLGTAAVVLLAVPVCAVAVSLLALRQTVIEPLGVVRQSGGAYVDATDEQIMAAARLTGRLSGVFAEPAGAAAVAGIAVARQQGILDPDADVVAMITGNGLKDIAGALKAVGDPHDVEPSIDAVSRVVKRC